MNHAAQQRELTFDRSQYRPDFAEWLIANMHIWQRFCAEADKVWQRGRRHYGGRTIFEYIRHETALKESDSQFSLNNNFAPDCVRLYQETYPERASLFSTRLMPGSARAA